MILPAVKAHVVAGMDLPGSKLVGPMHGCMLQQRQQPNSLHSAQSIIQRAKRRLDPRLL